MFFKTKYGGNRLHMPGGLHLLATARRRCLLDLMRKMNGA